MTSASKLGCRSIIVASITGLLISCTTIAQEKDPDKEGAACPEECCILGRWAVVEEGRYIVAIYKQNRVLRLCVDPGAAVVSVNVDGGGLVLIPGNCSDFEGKDFRIESRGPASSGSYDVVR